MPNPRGHLSYVLDDTERIAKRSIANVERYTKRRLIAYVTLFEAEAMIEPEDQRPLEDLMADVRDDEPLDLLVHSAGGLPDAAEALIRLTLRQSIRPFRVIVPAAAKSAATLMALAADSIVMGPSSQLGPIDPQVYHPSLNIYIAANSVLRARDKLIEKGNNLTQAELVMASRLDPAFVESCHQARERAKSLAVTWLKSWMLRNESQSEKQAHNIAYLLAESEKYTASHGQVIDHEEAEKIGLTIEYYQRQSPMWRSIWELYVRLDNLCRDGHSKVIVSRRRIFTKALSVPGRSS